MGRHGGANSRGLTGCHSDWHDPVGRECFMGSRDTASGQEDIVDLAEEQTSQRKIISLAVRQAIENGSLSLWVMNIQRVGPTSNHIIKAAHIEQLLCGQIMLAHNTACFPHPNRDTTLNCIRLLKARHIVAQKLNDLSHLPSAMPFGIT